MTVRDISSIIESWAPREIAWERDNVGLQVGSHSSRVRSILVCLDVTPEILDEAKRAKANLVVSHHPLLFKPLSTVSENGFVSRCLRMALRSRINIYSAHTNLDFTDGGTSFSLARSLGLEQIDFLTRPYKTMRKIVTFVPETHVDAVAAAMAEAGAGRIGDYDHCSFRVHGTGTFLANEAARPATGGKGRIEKLREVRLEMVLDSPKMENVTRALKKTHPYEEVAYEIYPIENRSGAYGMGAVGVLKRPMKLEGFLRSMKKRLKANSLRYTGQPGRQVRTVAVCGGSGSELLDEAINRKADVFVTADVRYHSFHDARGNIALVDAGHYETEFPVVKVLAERLRAAVKKNPRPPAVRVARTISNPVVSV